jgi:hypothetical protein
MQIKRTQPSQQSHYNISFTRKNALFPRLHQGRQFTPCSLTIHTLFRRVVPRSVLLNNRLLPPLLSHWIRVLCF